MRVFYSHMKKLFSVLSLLSVTLTPFLSVSAQTVPPNGSVIRGSGPALYYFVNNVRYVFPNEQTFFTWYTPRDYYQVNRLNDADLAAIRIGGNVTYRPGSRLVKITTDPKVYAIDHYGTLRWIETEATAQSMYGADWKNYIDDVPDAFFVTYSVGASIRRASDFRPPATLTPADDMR